MVLSRTALIGTAVAVVLAALMVASGNEQSLVIGVITGAGYGLVALGRLNRVTVFGIHVSDQRMLVLLALLVLAVVLALFFSRTNLGLAILAVSQEPVATELMGISVRRLSTLIWALAGILAGVAGI